MAPPSYRQEGTAVDALSFRRPIPDDAAALGALHVATWRETYAGLLPRALLDALSIEERSRMWRAAIEDPAAHHATALFLAEDGGTLVGFAACSDQRDAGLKARGYDGEFGAVYVLRNFQRHGIGRELIRLMARDLVARGRRAASLWVLRENKPARAFYERLGGVPAGEKCDRRPEATLQEIAYGWTGLTRLVRAAPTAVGDSPAAHGTTKGSG
jgi:ribosomal protein S18 acetylase RimI-like enzyme